MPNTTARPISRLGELEAELVALEGSRTLAQAKRAVVAVIRLLDSSADVADTSLFQVITDDQGKIRSNADWFMEDEVLRDRRSVYKIHSENSLNIDFKLFGIQKPGKRAIAWVQALTPNFEDEEFNSRYNVGIDFVVPKTLDRVIVVLSSNYMVRTLELKGKLTVTYHDILGKWLDIVDFGNKRAVHTVLWESFDLLPINKKFYAGVSERFVILRQHLETTGLMDARHASMFANRLIGRIIFCWFLDRKGVINDKIKYFEVDPSHDSTAHYRERLESLFYEVLNTPVAQRKAADAVTPFLNGGLFEPKASDFYHHHDLTFPKGYFADLFDFLRHYNFTTDESTSQFQQVAIDPEMLGRIFENLLAEITEDTGEQARKAKGAFYTPREIVDYMCRESLKQYLKGKLPADQNRDQRLAQLIDETEHRFKDQEQNYRRDWKPYKTAIIDALDEFTVLDPACGSGAFPMGMLQLLVQVYDRLETRFDPYKTKLSIIKRNIYGVDIEPMAIEISRLRAWLSIVVDEEADSTKIKPLPNLEFKFVCANTLLPLKREVGYFDKPGLEQQMREIRDEYYGTASHALKLTLRKRFEKLLNPGAINMFASEQEKQLVTYRPFDGESSAVFFDPDFMFGIKGGFDLVMGNPPYVSLERIGEHKDEYRKDYATATARGDLYCLFYERGLGLSKVHTGLLCFITSNKWMRAGYGDKLRAYFAEHNPLQLLDFGGYKVFESASVDTNVLLIENRASTKALMACRFENDYKKRQSFGEYCKSKSVVLTSTSSEPWIFGNLAQTTVRSKVESIGTSLRDWGESMNRGIITGLNEAFIINQKTRDELVGEDNRSVEIIKSVYRGRDVSRYGATWANIYVIVARFGLYKEIQSKYPAVHNHLKKFENGLKERGQCSYSRSGAKVKSADYAGQHHWLELDNNPKDEYLQLFEKNKVVWPETMRVHRTGDADFPRFSKLEAGSYCDKTLFFMCANRPDYLVGVLNSKIGWFLADQYADKLDVGGYMMQKAFVEKFPVPLPTEKNKELVQKIENSAQMIFAAKKNNPKADTKALEAEIDKIVFDLYGLTEEEIKVVESGTK